MRLVDKVLGSVRKEDVDWARPALVDSNRKRLRDQLSELIATAPSSVRAVIGDAESFARLATRTRNAYTHWTNRSGAATGGPLLALVEQLQLLVQARLMREIGIDEERTDALIIRSGLPRRAAHWKMAPEIS